MTNWENHTESESAVNRVQARYPGAFGPGGPAGLRLPREAAILAELGEWGIGFGPQDPLYAPLEPDEAGEAGDPPGGQGGPAAGQGGPVCGAGEAAGETGGLVRGDTPYFDLDGRRRWGLDYRLPPAPADGNALVGLFWGLVFTLGGAGAVGLVVLAGYWLWTVLPELAWRWSR